MTDEPITDMRDMGVSRHTALIKVHELSKHTWYEFVDPLVLILLNEGASNAQSNKHTKKRD